MTSRLLRTPRERNSPRLPRPSEVGQFAGVSPATRKVMQANKGRDTGPEMIVRRMVHAMGYRYRIHRKDLPGRPDIAFGPKRKAIFVHGCFWHAHDAVECRVASRPKTRSAFWEAKFERNRARDERSLNELRSLGWTTLVVWECELRDVAALRLRLASFLAPEAGVSA